jgi:hypothetical protein
MKLSADKIKVNLGACSYELQFLAKIPDFNEVHQIHSILKPFCKVWNSAWSRDKKLALQVKLIFLFKFCFFIRWLTDEEYEACRVIQKKF